MIAILREVNFFFVVSIVASAALMGCGGLAARKNTTLEAPVFSAPASPSPSAQSASQASEVKEPDSEPKEKIDQTGAASWYGPQFHGKETASGETFNQNELTAAHKTLPLGTEAKVTNVETGKSVNVTINDRGPYVKGRNIDLSRAAAQKIGITKKKGIAKVKITANSKQKARTKKSTKNKEKRAD